MSTDEIRLGWFAAQLASSDGYSFEGIDRSECCIEVVPLSRSEPIEPTAIDRRFLASVWSQVAQ
jgi:hypothetical protein